MYTKYVHVYVILNRCQSASDIDKSEDEVSHLADDIELKLYNLHNQVNK